MITGIPVLILEIAMGHKSQQGAGGSFSFVDKKYEWLGWVVICVGFVVTTYYAAVMSWSFNYLWDSFTLAWGENTADHFFKTTLGLTSGPFDFAGIKFSLFIGLLLTWLAIIACLWKGPQTVGKVVYATVIIPWLILIVLVIRGVTLEGSGIGLEYYLHPTFSKLLDPSIWRAAFAQVFFSLSIGLAIMFAYGSYLPRKARIVSDVYIIAICDSLTAFIGGLAVFGALGYLSAKTGTPITELKAAGPGLAFVVYPTIINNLPMLNSFFGVLFFLMLLTLGIDSAFSLVEASACGLKDKFGWSNLKANFIVSGASFTIGLLFISGSGLYWLDIVDYFMNHFGLIFACLIECIVFAWIYKIDKIKDHINSLHGMKVGKFWIVMIKYVSPLVLLFMIASEIVTRIGTAYEGYPRTAELVGWVVMFVLVPLAAILITRKKLQKTSPTEQVIL